MRSKYLTLFSPSPRPIQVSTQVEAPFLNDTHMSICSGIFLLRENMCNDLKKKLISSIKSHFSIMNSFIMFIDWIELDWMILHYWTLKSLLFQMYTYLNYRSLAYACFRNRKFSVRNRTQFRTLLNEWSWASCWHVLQLECSHRGKQQLNGCDGIAHVYHPRTIYELFFFYIAPFVRHQHFGGIYLIHFNWWRA